MYTYSNQLNSNTKTNTANEKYKPRDQCKHNKLALMLLCMDFWRRLPYERFSIYMYTERKSALSALRHPTLIPTLGYWFLIHSSRTRSTLTYFTLSLLIMHRLFTEDQRLPSSFSSNKTVPIRLSLKRVQFVAKKSIK